MAPSPGGRQGGGCADRGYVCAQENRTSARDRERFRVGMMLRLDQGSGKQERASIAQTCFQGPRLFAGWRTILVQGVTNRTAHSSFA